MYRDFLYLDLERVQSIIAQLEKGVLEKVIEGKSAELEGKAGIAAGVLASFLPLSFDARYASKSNAQSSKILHDYSFNLALEALEQNGLILEGQNDWNRDDVPLPDASFISVRGVATVLDYQLIKTLAENEFMINSLFGTTNEKGYAKPKGRQQHKKQKSSPLQDIALVVDAMMGDTIQIKLDFSSQITLAGPLKREFLREETRDFIFKYGGRPQENWVMLAQVSQVTMPLNKLRSLNSLMSRVNQFSADEMNTALDAIDPLVDILSAFQAAIASVSYPAIAVTPIAVYREIVRVS